MDFASCAARWVVGKALASVTDTVLEAWADSKNLGTNVEALKMELLCVQAMLDGTCGWEQDNRYLEVLLQKLQDLAYKAGDLLDDLDYFRIQDELDGTSQATDELNLVRNAKAVGRHLWLPACCSSAATPPGASASSHANQADGEANSCMPKVTFGACNNTIGALGKCLPCSSLPPVRDDNNDGQSDDNAPHRQKKHEDATSNKLRFDRVDISNKMKGIVEIMRSTRQQVSKILRTIGSRHNNAHATDMVQSRPITTSESIEPELHGRKTTMIGIVKDITVGIYSDKELTVLPIFGPGGIGKTTLTQHIYHNQEVQKHFDVKVWTCIPLNFNVDKLMEEIKKYIPKIGDETTGTAAELIGQRLKSKRLLLVLDDIWDCSNEDEWTRLLLPFRKSQVKGSVIIVTTRFPTIARMVKTSNQSIELESLDHEEFKKLFLAFVGTKQSLENHIMLLDIGDKILDKLKGNPLAAKTVGRLLRNNLDLGHWERVLENKEWESQEGDHDIMPALKLSYDYLPFHLKQCFSYCALFPKDYMFDSKELIYFWIGLDVLQSSRQYKEVEDTGLDSLNDLVSYGFFKKEERFGRTFYLIHDLLHDVALKVAHECLTIDQYNMRSLEIGPSVRHLSIIVDCVDDSDGIRDEDFLSELRVLEPRLKIEGLQTFMISGLLDEVFADLFRDLIRKANNLRVLHLSRMRYRANDQCMLHNLPILSHLRYLSLEMNYSWEIHLPGTLSRLYHLRILDLQKWHGCPDMLRDISSLTKLRHIVSSNEWHSEIGNVGKLQFLQELKAFKVNKENNGYELKQLGSLVELRELGIYGLERIHTKEAAAEANLLNKRYLQKLKLDWRSEVPSNERDMEGLVLEKLQPQRHLQELCIGGHGSRFCPTWLSSKLSVKALKFLHLDGVNWEVLPSLGKMGMLHELKLKNMSTLQEFYPGHFSCINGKSFCSLKRLTLVGLAGLEKWAMGDQCHLFFQLEVFIIKDCPNLLGLPFTDNNVYFPPSQDQERKTQWFPNLQELEINNCSKVVLLPLIPWTRTLSSVKIDKVGSPIVKSLKYAKSPWAVELEINGKDLMHSLEKVLVFVNLTDLQNLEIHSCPSLQFKDLQMLRSLKSLQLRESVLVPSGSEGEVTWQIPVERLFVNECRVTGKGLTQLLSHLPKLSELRIWDCEKIMQMGVAVEQQQLTAHTHIPAASASAVRIEDAQATTTCQQQEITEEAEEIEKGEDGMLLLPAHLSGSIRRLDIRWFHNVSLLAAYPPLVSNGHGCKTGRSGEGGGGGLHALRSLQELRIKRCPKLFDAYTIASFCSTPCLPFPCSLKKLELWGVEGMGTLEPISNLTCLTRLELLSCGDDLSGDGLWPLVTRGNLSELHVIGSPKFFVGSDLIRGLQEQFVRRSYKLMEVRTDDAAGFLAAPICTILSSSLTKLTLRMNNEVDRFTKEQEGALRLLTSLLDLEFQFFCMLQCLPAGLHTLPNLRRLEIRGCELVSSLPNDGLPVSLQELDVRYCCNHELGQQCRNFIHDHPGIKLII